MIIVISLLIAVVGTLAFARSSAAPWMLQLAAIPAEKLQQVNAFLLIFIFLLLFIVTIALTVHIVNSSSESTDKNHLQIQKNAEEAVRLAQEIGLATQRIKNYQQRLNLSVRLAKTVSSSYQQEAENDRRGLEHNVLRFQTLAAEYGEIIQHLCKHCLNEVEISVNKARLGLVQTGSQTARQLVKSHLASCATSRQAEWIQEIEVEFSGLR